MKEEQDEADAIYLAWGLLLGLILVVITFIGG